MTTGGGERRLLGGRYALEERIATGAMGEVWRGRDTLLQRAVAVKVLRGEYADDPTFIERFRAEARRAAALNHPNIAAVLDYGEATAEGAGGHLAYLVMELVEGAPLSARLSADGAMRPVEALSVLRQTAAGLAEAHRRGIVHRDVRPANILVRPDGAVKLTDFGVARSADSVPSTGIGQVIGTAQYLSPEQAQGEPATPASDVYALGLVGYESLTGQVAFTGDDPVAVALSHVVGEPRPLPEDLPHDVRELIDAALAKDPGDRIPDGGAFLDAVQETLHQYEPEGTAEHTRPLARRALVGAGTAPTPGTVLTSGPVMPAVVEPPPARRRALMVLAPLLLLLLAAGTLAVVLHGARSADEPVAEGHSAAADRGILLAEADHVGRRYEDVAGELGALGLDVVRVDRVTGERPAGTVLGVSPVGTRLEEGAQVRLTVAVAPAEKALPEVPDTPAGSVRPRGTGTTAAGDDGAPAPGTTSGVPAPADQGGTPGAGSPAGDGSGAPGAGGADPGTAAPSPAEPSPVEPSPVEPSPVEPSPAEPSPADVGTPDPGSTDSGADPDTDPGTAPATDPEPTSPPTAEAVPPELAQPGRASPTTGGATERAAPDPGSESVETAATGTTAGG